MPFMPFHIIYEGCSTGRHASPLHIKFLVGQRGPLGMSGRGIEEGLRCSVRLMVHYSGTGCKNINPVK